MKIIKVLGSGCSNCEKTADIIQKFADDNGIRVKVLKETNLEQIMHYGVMSTPAVVINEEVVHSGTIPGKDQIKSWLI